jgi:hypothetical protein
MPRAQTELRLLGQLGAETSWSRTEDRPARTAAARAAADARFLREAGGDPQRAEHLRRAHFRRLALKSVRSRRLAREAREAIVTLIEAAEQAEAELAELEADGDA